jgi:hypothetical protein
MKGISQNEGIYSIFEYEDSENIPSEVLIRYPSHHHIADLILPEVYYFNRELRFEWKASWYYRQLPVLSIYYQDIIVQEIFNASIEIVVLFLNEYKNIDLAIIRERQVQTLWKENVKLKNNIESIKREMDSLKKLNTEVLARIK